ncbi:MAG: GUN4 domain-containing protein [Microcystis aeruginosa BS13-02]|jgi:hypothetical protein|nr:GUN4 domain-containing protein [Microcystis aeruginosa BS13-02]
MLAAAKREKEGWIDSKSAEKFSCEDLRMIDREWLAASGGKFGFSVQLAIYKQAGIAIWSLNLYLLAEAVGWQVNGNWKDYSDLTWSTNAPSLAPKGHLPQLGRGRVKGVLGVWEGFVNDDPLSSRVAACEL